LSGGQGESHAVVSIFPASDTVGWIYSGRFLQPINCLVRIHRGCLVVSPLQSSMKHQDPSFLEDPEKLVAIRKIRMLMDFWQIRPHELRGKPTDMPAPKVKAEVRYRHPVSGLTWDGVGGQPPWLREALLREGYTVDELRRAAGLSPDSCSAEA
jgi:DNA-binding protein H-NS